MAAAKKSVAQPPMPRRNSIEDTIKVTDPNMLILEELRRVRNEMKELRHEMKEDLKEACQDSREEIKDSKLELKRDLEDLGKKVTKITTDMNKIQKEVDKIKEKTQQLDKTTKDLRQDLNQHSYRDWTNELRYRERCIKIRGVVEQRNENLMDRIIVPLAQFMECTPEILLADLDKMFRINSIQSKEYKTPRDIVICFIRSSTRDRIIQRSYENKLIIDNIEAKIFKDIPPQLMQERQKYKFLTQLLFELKIEYKWERIEGLSLIYKQKRYKIDNLEKAKEMEKKLLKEKSNKNKESDEETPERYQRRKEWRAKRNHEYEQEKKYTDKIKNKEQEEKKNDAYANHTTLSSLIILDNPEINLTSEAEKKKLHNLDQEEELLDKGNLIYE